MPPRRDTPAEPGKRVACWSRWPAWGSVSLPWGLPPRGTSGRNTQGQVAETLNTTGIYSLVRNPLYLGNFLIWLGLS
ncbi:MAG: hypothetical protein WCC75_12145, partial [Desulfobaccales bacterium]